LAPSFLTDSFRPVETIMTEQTWAWRIVDGETNETRRFYLDGAALAAVGKPHPKSFWDRHPLVERVENRWVGPDDEVEIRVWLNDKAAAEAVETIKPDRPADLNFSGEWRGDHDFWAAHPDVEHVDLRQHVGAQADDDLWTVDLWLKA
jgi:hypothetical protein